jgi:hypothetical protein
MKSLKIAAIIALLLPLCSCVPIQSFYPLWDEKHAALEPGLLGIWTEPGTDNESLLTFTKSDVNTYLATYAEKDKKNGNTKSSTYTAKLVRLEKYLFIDFINEDKTFDKWTEGEAYLSILPTHFFGRLELAGDTMKLALLDDEKLEKKVTNKEIDLSIIKQEDLRLLTSETGKIQQALGQFAADKDLWGEPDTLQRKTK